MSSSPIPPTPMVQHARARQQQGLNRVLGFVVFSALLGPLSGIVSLVLYGLVRRSPRRMAILALGLLAGLVVVALAYRTMLAEVQTMLALMQPYREPLRALVRRPTAEHWQAFLPLFGAAWPLLRLLWQQLLPLATLIALFLEGTRTKTVEEQRAEKERRAEARDREQHRQAAAKVAAAPEVVAGRAVIGVPIAGDLGIMAKGWAVYDADLLGRHAVVVGGSGTGKTECILRIAYLARKVYGWKVFYLDAKGDPANAARFQAVMAQAQTEAALFPALGYDGWQGDATAILNRLMAVEDYSEPYYRALAKTVLSLAVQAPEGPPRSSAALLERLQLDRLQQLYAGEAGMQAEVLSSLNDESVNGVRRRYFGFFQSLDQKLDGAWSFDSVDAGYLLLDGLALKEEAISLGRYLLEDFAHYAAKRKPSEQRVLFIAEEFSAISAGGADAANLFERVRSYGAGMLVTSQSVEGLGADAARLFGAAAVTIAFQCADPELLAKRAGMRAEVQSSVQVSFPAIPGQNALARGRSQLLGTSTQHEREVLKLHPDTIRQFAIGECCFITNGSYQLIRVARIPALPPARTADPASAPPPQAVPITRPVRVSRRVPPPAPPQTTPPDPALTQAVPLLAQERGGAAPPTPVAQINEG